MGALVGAVGVIGLRSIVDIPTALLALVSALALIYSKKIQEPHIILVAAAIGFLVKIYF